MPTQAIIFDLDGLLVDSEPLHQRAFNQYLTNHRIPYQFEQVEYGRRFVGIPVRANAEYLITRFGLSCPPEDVLTEREALFEQLISSPANLTPMPGLVNVLQAVSQRGLTLAVASASPRNQVEIMLRGLEIANFFKVVVSGSDVQRPKPAPDVYILALERLGVAKPACFAVEDSATGVASARAAGLKVVAVPNRYTREQDLTAAYAVLDHLEQILSFID